MEGETTLLSQLDWTFAANTQLGSTTMTNHRNRIDCGIAEQTICPVVDHLVRLIEEGVVLKKSRKTEALIMQHCGKPIKVNMLTHVIDFN